MTRIENNKEQQIQSLRRGVDAIAEERAVGMLIIVQPDSDETAVMSLATANMTPEEALAALAQAYKMVKGSLSDEPDLH